VVCVYIRERGRGVCIYKGLEDAVMPEPKALFGSAGRGVGSSRGAATLASIWTLMRPMEIETRSFQMQNKSFLLTSDHKSEPRPLLLYGHGCALTADGP
jgi:hypothetical protein